MSQKCGIRICVPPHPGAFIKHDIIEPRGLTVMAAASVLGVTSATFSTLLNERTSLPSDLAVRVEKLFGVSQVTLAV